MRRHRVIASSRTVVSPRVRGRTFSVGPQRALTSQVDVWAFAGVARCGRCASHHFRAARWSQRSAVLQVLAICSNSSALAGRRFGSLRRQARTNSSTPRGICSSVRCDGGIGSSCTCWVNTRLRGDHRGRAVATLALHDSEIQHLSKVVFEAHATEIDIRRLDITMNQSHRVRFTQGAAYLTYQVHHARRWQRPEVADEGLEIVAIQQLHHVVEGTPPDLCTQLLGRELLAY